jgi:branched-chain amino acid transport system substrate-binding protein
MKHRAAAAAALGFVLLTACGVGTPSTGAFQRTINVALVDVFSGSAGYLGMYAQNSLQVEVDQLNAKGGVLGSRVEIVPADNELGTSKTVELVRQQLAADDVGLVVGPNSNAAFGAVKQDIGRAQMPNCVTRVGDDALTGAAFTFRTGAPDRFRVAALLKQLQSAHPEIKKIGLIDEGEEGGQAYDRQLADQAARSGLTYAGRSSVGGADADHRAAAQRSLDQGVQALVLSDQPAAAARTALAVKQLGAGGKLQLLGFGGLAGYDFATAAGDAAVGTLIATSISSYLSDVPQARWPMGYRTFVSKVTSQYGLASNGVELKAAPAAADCIVQWARAVQRAGTFQGAAVARAWETLDVPSSEAVQGVHEVVSPGEHSSVPADGVFVYTWAKLPAGYKLQQLAGPSS